MELRRKKITYWDIKGQGSKNIQVSTLIRIPRKTIYEMKRKVFCILIDNIR